MSAWQIVQVDAHVCIALSHAFVMRNRRVGLIAFYSAFAGRLGCRLASLANT